MRNYNYKVSIFRKSTIERITWKTPLYGLQAVTVSPKGTTHSEDYVMKRYGLDKRTAISISHNPKGKEKTYEDLERPTSQKLSHTL